MQRCQSIITTPSSRFQVAPVGQTRVQGGLSQWLQKTRTWASRRCSAWNALLWSWSASSKGSFQIHLTSSLGLSKWGTLWALWQAAMQSWQSVSSRHFAMSMAMAQRLPTSGFSAGRAGPDALSSPFTGRARVPATPRAVAPVSWKKRLLFTAI